uniref:class F sortase n=1 Tax=Rhodococcus qingshengii TaxID=334542 RepID=UPI0027E39371|nr:class F sortase [Rhodococcus qingshengii]
MNPDNSNKSDGGRQVDESGIGNSAPRGTRMRAVLAAVAVLAIIIGSIGVYYGTHDSSTSATDTATTSSATPHDAVPIATTTHGTLSLDPINIDTSVVDATVINGVLTPPADVSEVGIWLDGAPLDSATGTTLIAGHVNLAGQGNGALFDLGTLTPGQEIHITSTSGNTTTWRVSAVVSRPKAAGIEESVLAGPDGPRKLAVVTCGGDLEYEGGIGNYLDNVYLYADIV